MTLFVINKLDEDARDTHHELLIITIEVNITKWP